MNVPPEALGMVHVSPASSAAAELLSESRVHASYPLSLATLDVTGTNGGLIARADG